MELRNHPLMSYGSVPNWPPAWVWTGGKQNKLHQGEIGILKNVMLAAVEPINKCYLIIEHDGESYIGCLSFADSSFCHRVYRLLERHCGASLKHIGGIDVHYPV